MAGEYGGEDTYGSLTLEYGAFEDTTPPDPEPQPTPHPPAQDWDLTGTSFDPAIPEPTGPYRFTPPAGPPVGPISMWAPTIRANPLGTRLMAHYAPTAFGLDLFKLLDGTYTTDQPVPTIVNHQSVPANQVIVHRYRATTVETVSAAERAALMAAGYTVDTVGGELPTLYDSGFLYDDGNVYA